MDRANVLIIGGGIVGLSIASKISEGNEGVFVLERNRRVGQEISTHNSGVIHSGIHYPNGSLKASLSVTGNRMLYDLCRGNSIAHKKLGKLTVANGETEVKKIEQLKRQGAANGVEDLEILDRDAVRGMEPKLEVEKALYSPSSGIVEPDELIAYFEAVTRKNGAAISLDTEVKTIRRVDSGYEVKGMSGGGGFSLTANTIINSGGLYSDRIAASVGLDIDRLGYRLHYCKGDYFRISGTPAVKHLVYPVPEGSGLGIHLTPDMAGSVKLGPNAYYVDRIDYKIASRPEEFLNGVRIYMPSITEAQIHEDSSGVRPKLQGPNDSFRDFVIREESDHGYPAFINLIGIESPGLTAAPAIGELVADLYENQVR